MFHNSDLEYLDYKNQVDERSFRMKSDQDQNTCVTSIYFSDAQEWRSFDCEAFVGPDETSSQLEEFIHSYFSSNNSSIFSEEMFPISSGEASTSADEESERGVQGGKYGFAIFIKHQGPLSLQKLSLGKIC